MKTIFLIFPLIIAKSSGHSIRGTFYDRILNDDSGRMCVDNPVCVAQGLTNGLCCPNANREYESCCNRDCSAHTDCSHLANQCCPTVDNVELDCCNHQPALDALVPSASPSDLPTSHPNNTPSVAPSSAPSQSSSPSASPTGSTPTPRVMEPSSSPSSVPSLAPSSRPPSRCPFGSFRVTSSVQTLTTDGVSTHSFPCNEICYEEFPNPRVNSIALGSS